MNCQFRPAGRNCVSAALFGVNVFEIGRDLLSLSKILSETNVQNLYAPHGLRQAHRQIHDPLFHLFGTLRRIQHLHLRRRHPHHPVHVRPLVRLDPVDEFPRLALNSEFMTQAVSYLYSRIFEEFHPIYMLAMLACIIIVINFLSNLFRYLGAWTIENMRTRTLQRLRNDLFSHVIGMNVGFFSEQRKGDVMSRITNDVMMVQFCITNTLQVIAREPFLVIGFIAAMINISWGLSVFAIVFLPVVALLVGSIVKRLRHPALRSQEKMGEMVSTLDESLSGVKLIKSYNATRYIREKFYAINAEFSRLQLSMVRRQQLASPMSEFLGITAVGIVLVFGGVLVMKGSLNAASFIIFIGMFSQITRPVRAIIDQFATINQGIAAGERVLALLDVRSEIVDKPEPKSWRASARRSSSATSASPTTDRAR